MSWRTGGIFGGSNSGGKEEFQLLGPPAVRGKKGENPARCTRKNWKTNPKNDANRGNFLNNRLLVVVLHLLLLYFESPITLAAPETFQFAIPVSPFAWLSIFEASIQQRTAETELLP